MIAALTGKLAHKDPEEIVVDVTKLEVGMSVHVRDLPLPAGVELRSDSDLSVLSIVAPKTEEEPSAEEISAEEAAEIAEGEAGAADTSGEPSDD